MAFNQRSNGKYFQRPFCQKSVTHSVRIEDVQQLDRLYRSNPLKEVYVIESTDPSQAIRNRFYEAEMEHGRTIPGPFGYTLARKTTD